MLDFYNRCLHNKVKYLKKSIKSKQKVLFFIIILEIKIGIFGILYVTKKSDFERVKKKYNNDY